MCLAKPEVFGNRAVLSHTRVSLLSVQIAEESLGDMGSRPQHRWRSGLLFTIARCRLDCSVSQA